MHKHTERMRVERWNSSSGDTQTEMSTGGQCEYCNVGCKSKMCRKDLKQHKKLKVEQHLDLSYLKLNNLECLVYWLAVNDVSGTSEDNEYWCMQLRLLATITASSGDQVCPVIIEMLGFAAVKKNEEQWFSESFFTHNKGYKMCLCVDTDDLMMTMTLVMTGVMLDDMI